MREDSRVARGVAASRARKAQRWPTLLVALPAVIICYAQLGPVGGTVTVVGGLGGIAGLVCLLLAIDRRRRRLRLKPGELAATGATMHLEELRRLRPEIDVHLRLSGILVGELCVTTEGLGWRPASRLARRGVPEFAWPWLVVDHIEVQRLPSALRCDAMAIVPKTGDDAIVYVTAPGSAERAIRSLGIPLHESGPA